jgi:hypothetical protein
MHYSMGKMRLPFIDSDLLYSALYGRFDYFQEKNYYFFKQKRFKSKKSICNIVSILY